MLLKLIFHQTNKDLKYEGYSNSSNINLREYTEVELNLILSPLVVMPT